MRPPPFRTAIGMVDFEDDVRRVDQRDYVLRHVTERLSISSVRQTDHVSALRKPREQRRDGAACKDVVGPENVDGDALLPFR